MPAAKPTRPSLSTLAAELGLSVASVSNAFNKPDRVSDQLRTRVLEAAERAGYPGPGPAARHLRRGRSDAVGVLITTELSVALGEPAAIAFLAGLARVCESADQNVLLLPAHHRASQEPRLDGIRNAVVDGFVVYSVPDEDPHLAAILARRAPVVIVDAPVDVPGTSWVGPDDRAATRELANFLHALGHRRVGVVTSRIGAGRLNGMAGRARWETSPYSVMRERIAGLAERFGADLPVQERAEQTRDSGAAALHDLLDREPDLTAVCCLSDVLALGALTAARERGLDVPGDLTVTGFDAIADARAKGLTTVSQPLTDKGRIAGELYLALDAGASPSRRLLPTTLEVRASSGPVRGRKPLEDR